MSRDAKVSPSKFVLEVTRNRSGDIERIKSRFVILGNMQQTGVDYDSTISLVVAFTTIGLMVTVCSKKADCFLAH